MADRDPRVPWYYQPVWIALLTFAVLGPLALPLVWRSPALGPRGRAIGVVLILLYTVALFASTAAVVVEVLDRMR